MSSQVSHFYEFGPFTLDASERTLRRGDSSVHLTPKEMDILLALVRAGGRLMPKEELLKEVWPGTFVEERTLAQNIFTLRKALARADAEQSYIETVPRRGYRFVAKVTERREGEETTAGEEAARPGELHVTGAGSAETNGENLTGGAANGESAAAYVPGANIGALNDGALHASAPPPTRGAELPLPERGGHPARAAVLITLAVVLAFGALVFAVYKLSLRPHLEARPAPFESMQLTRLPVPGAAFDAALSPDGRVLAYVNNDPGGQSIWVTQVDAASDNKQIVAPTQGVDYPVLTFSPDGRHVYYAWAPHDRPGADVYRVPVLGGPPQKVFEGISSPFSFSPDGRSFAFVRGNDNNSRNLFIASADGGEVRQLAASSPPRSLVLPAWSPDGRSIACVFALTDEYERGNAYMGVTTFDAKDGSELQAVPGRWFGINQLAWLPGGDGLVLSAIERELSPAQIWRVSYPGGEARRVTNDLNSYQSLSVSADARTLVTVQTDRVPNVWVAPASDPSRAQQITAGTGKFDGYYGVSWTPDGRIVYSSVAGGAWDIWVMNADGTGRRQLTVGARSNYGPSVSPDGRYIVFVSNRAGGPFNVWRMDADGSNPKQLTSGKGENFAHVTPDGRWVVYATTGFNDRNLIWKVPIDGGEPVALTERHSSWPYVSPDGKQFVCVYAAENQGPPKLAVLPFEGGPPSKLFDIEPSFRMNTVWLPDNRGVAYVDARSGTHNIWLQPLNGGKPVQFTDYKTDHVTAYDFSRDGRLVVTRTVETTGVVLIRNAVTSDK